MHHIYRTKAFVVNSFEHKESDKFLILLSHDFGLIYVNAQGIRKNNSKLKHALQNYSLAEVALVRGKTGYKLTNAKLIKNLYHDLKDIEKQKLMAQVFVLLEKLIHGEEHSQDIFIVINDLYSRLKTETDLKRLELVAVANLLFILGYFNRFFDADFKLEDLTDEECKKIIKEINNSLKATHL